jgi:hypothetical protein
MAKWILEHRKITHDPVAAAFVVNYQDTTSLVQLFPVEKCTCVMRVDCSHIIACKMSIGIKIPTSVKFDRNNLTKLARNAKSNVVTGRKNRHHAANSE